MCWETRALCARTYTCIFRTPCCPLSPALSLPLILNQSQHEAARAPPLLRCHAPPKPRKAAVCTGAACKEEWKREVERRRRRRSGTEQGSRRWRAGERGFFGKGANPITGSGAAPVSLATLNSHFNGLFLRLLIPFPSIFVPLPDAFSPFCYRARHSRTLSKCAS